MPSGSLKPTAKPAAPRERRQTLAIEPRVAKLVRDVMRHERILLSELIEQALIAWIRRWREGQYDLEVERPEGPPQRTQIFAIGETESPSRRGMFDEPAEGLAYRIPKEKGQRHPRRKHEPSAGRPVVRSPAGAVKAARLAPIRVRAVRSQAARGNVVTGRPAAD